MADRSTLRFLARIVTYAMLAEGTRRVMPDGPWWSLWVVYLAGVMVTHFGMVGRLTGGAVRE